MPEILRPTAGIRRPVVPIVALAALALSACASAPARVASSSPAPSAPSATPSATSSTTPSATSSTAPATTPPAAAVTITVSVNGGRATPAARQVDVPVGATVDLRVTSDTADEVHVHGYELERRVTAGGTAEIRFTADQTGVFEVETHESGLLLLKLAVS